MADTIESPLLGVGEAAAFLHVSTWTVRAWEQKGLIKRIAGTTKFTRSEVERFAGVRQEPKTPEQRKRGPYGKRRK